MKKFVILLITILLFGCSEKQKNSINILPKAQGEFFSAMQINDTAYFVGVMKDKKRWKAALTIYNLQSNTIKNILFGEQESQMFHSIKQIKNNLLITGSVLDSMYLKLWLLEIDKNFQPIWQKKFQVPNQNLEGIKTIQLFDNLIIIGSTYTKLIPPQICILKTDLKGNILKKILLKKNYKTSVKDITVYDSTIVITGITSQIGSDDNLFVAMLNQNLDTLWFKSVPLILNDRGQKITTDEQYIYIAGYTQSKGNGLTDGWILKLDKKGKIVKQTTIGTKTDQWLTGIKIIGKQLITTGITIKQNLPYLFVAKFDKDLNLINTHTFDNTEKTIFGLNDSFINKKQIINAGFYYKNDKLKLNWFSIINY